MKQKEHDTKRQSYETKEKAYYYNLFYLCKRLRIHLNYLLTYYYNHY